jgi:hypothetical protein
MATLSAELRRTDNVITEPDFGGSVPASDDVVGEHRDIIRVIPSFCSSVQSLAMVAPEMPGHAGDTLGHTSDCIGTPSAGPASVELVDRGAVLRCYGEVQGVPGVG